MIEEWKEFLDQGGAYGALLTDLSKAFYCLIQDLTTVKFYAFGVDMSSLTLFNSKSTS